jgi:hypothetical protein
MICVACGEPAIIKRSVSDMCQFCWDCLSHELKIRLDAIRDFGQYHHGNCGPNFFCVYYTGEYTLGRGLYLPRTAEEAMGEAHRIGVRNNWLLLQVNKQKTLKDIFVSPHYTKYMGGTLQPLPYY